MHVRGIDFTPSFYDFPIIFSNCSYDMVFLLHILIFAKKYLRHEYLHLGQRSNTCYGSCLLPRRLLDYNIIIYNW